MDKIKVWPGNAAMLAALRHPSGVKLRSMTEPVEWPADAFTFRRLQDGDITDQAPPAGAGPANTDTAPAAKPPK